MHRRGRGGSPRGRAWVAALLLAALPGGRAAAQPPGPAPALDAKAEEALRVAVMQWWDARDRKDHQAMYDLYEPAYRARVSFGSFVQENAVRSRYKLTDVRIAGVEVEGHDRARVSLEYKGTVPHTGRAHASRAQDTWVRADGRWYKVYQPPTVPFVSARPPSPP